MAHQNMATLKWTHWIHFPPQGLGKSYLQLQAWCLLQRKLQYSHSDVGQGRKQIQGVERGGHPGSCLEDAEISNLSVLYSHCTEHFQLFIFGTTEHGRGHPESPRLLSQRMPRTEAPSLRVHHRCGPGEEGRVPEPVTPSIETSGFFLSPV